MATITNQFFSGKKSLSSVSHLTLLGINLPNCTAAFK